MVMKAILVESDPALRQQLSTLLAYYPSVQVIAQVDTTEAVFPALRENRADVIFANVQPAPAQFTSDGTSLAAMVAEYYPDVQVVLYAPKEEMNGRIIAVPAAGYLALPFDNFALQRIVKRLGYVHELQQYKRDTVNRNILVKTREGYQMLKLGDILFVERSNRKNRIVTREGKEIYLYRYTLDELETQLSGSGFYRCYQSFIVNLSKVASVRADNEKKSYTILFEDYDGEILLSRDKYAEFVALLKERFANISI